MVPIMSAAPSYQPIQSQIKLGVNGIKPWLIWCDQVHMSNKLDDSAFASESEHDFGVLVIGCAKKYGPVCETCSQFFIRYGTDM